MEIAENEEQRKESKRERVAGESERIKGARDEMTV